MFFQEINSTTAQRHIDRLFKMAYKKPTLLTRANGEDVMVVSKKHYAKLVKEAGQNASN